ncbi:response regulator transcription factor [Clostridium sp. D2Q-11]|uniref:Response regulator transcription factor n=1 Tax=Anaeromonas frigoriresistens TaxID=2683708 RepID=A0A942USS8_9FIRM|nr:response regulator transcription factor [Anaeromonas frigoriresistens]MBS4537913.1 response regulator transcription factor [Anaeromonas frigoriresistens]
MIRVIIADDQHILTEGLQMILGKEKDIDICGIAQNGKEAYDMCNLYKPNIILMDIKMPIMNGVEATKKIKEKYPNIKILVLTTFKDDEYIYEALRYGASGYLLKDASPVKIAEAIRTVYEGGALIQSEVAAKVINKFSQMANNEEKREYNPKLDLLTGREKDICRLLAEGKNNKEISKELYLSEGTVKNHITKVLNKLDLRDRTQLAIFSIKNTL